MNEIVPPTRISVIDGVFYRCLITPDEHGIVLESSPYLSSLGGASTLKLVWTSDGSGSPARNLRSAELRLYGDNFYIYFTAAADGQGDYRLYVLKSFKKKPYGQYYQPRQLAHRYQLGYWASDPTFFTNPNNGVQYMIWTGIDQAEPFRYNLYLAPLTDPVTQGGSRQFLAGLEHRWQGQWLGAASATTNATEVNVVYTVLGERAEDSAVGLLYASFDSNIANFETWERQGHPFMASDPRRNIIGPRYAAFVEGSAQMPLSIHFVAGRDDEEPRPHLRQIVGEGAPGSLPYPGRVVDWQVPLYPASDEAA